MEGTSHTLFGLEDQRLKIVGIDVIFADPYRGLTFIWTPAFIDL